MAVLILAAHNLLILMMLKKEKKQKHAKSLMVIKDPKWALRAVDNCLQAFFILLAVKRQSEINFIFA